MNESSRLKQSAATPQLEVRTISPHAGVFVHWLRAKCREGNGMPGDRAMTVELLTLFVVAVLFCGFEELKMDLRMDDDDWLGEVPN